ncbi:hypothetical protein D1B33_07440 [Lysinibacillus yapensis]|uniref:Siphovirus-type tail component RIFT-related domain-containing protein n=1 Tax=Ureibacillus yapensis TaxID=2304605 RepID=A0A396SBE7_9BACL|nr:distal tail protein Dit [Lysinibacillus yapensis]RHW38698.1 hypothetical protein D1B33_07440 [Lysinibacillus yapensis]
MNDGVTFNNKHCSALELELLESSRPLLAENKDTFEELPHLSGSILIPDNSKRDIEVTATFLLSTLAGESFNDACRRIAAWLNVTTWSRLIFDDDPNYYYQAKPIGMIDREQITRNDGQFTVTFRCHPEMKVVV